MSGKSVFKFIRELLNLIVLLSFDKCRVFNKSNIVIKIFQEPTWIVLTKFNISSIDH